MGTCGTAHISTVSCARVRGAGQRPEHWERRVLGGGGARHATWPLASQPRSGASHSSGPVASLLPVTGPPGCSLSGVLRVRGGSTPLGTC